MSNIIPNLSAPISNKNTYTPIVMISYKPYLYIVRVSVLLPSSFCVNGHLKTGTFGHEKSSTKSWKLIPPLHQPDLVEPNGCEFGSCHRAG